METPGLEPDSASVEELRILIDRALIASDAAGEAIVGCYLQLARDKLDEHVVSSAISTRMQ